MKREFGVNDACELDEKSTTISAFIARSSYQERAAYTGLLSSLTSVLRHWPVAVSHIRLGGARGDEVSARGRRQASKKRPILRTCIHPRSKSR